VNVCLEEDCCLLGWASCDLVEFYLRFWGACCYHRPFDGGRTHIWDVGKLVPDCTVQQPQEPCSYSPPWEPETPSSSEYSICGSRFEFRMSRRVSQSVGSVHCTPAVILECTSGVRRVSDSLLFVKQTVDLGVSRFWSWDGLCVPVISAMLPTDVVVIKRVNT
jgi:hypothetical protein